ncbi:MAG: prolyl oligopeptidase family protein [Phycisphaerales bacterium]|nr:prolyl oligopeptidase family protein [Phycisphaerales bacterium]
MLSAASLALFAIYLLLPPVTLGVMFRGNLRRRRFILGGWISGIMLAAAVLAIYSIGIGGRLPVSQALVAIYFGVALMMFLKLVDALLTRSLSKMLLGRWPARWRFFAIAGLRLVLFGGFALPWVMAAVMVYRPRIVVDEPPVTLQTNAERVTFPASDGGRVAAWYVAPADPSETTALLCHGLGGNTAGFFRMIDALHEAGIGVLAIDFRAHGESSGQLCSFGYREKYDVLGAIAWLKGQHPKASQRIVGVGASLGGAALLAAAAADPRIDGVAVLSTYSSLPDELNDVSHRNFIPPFSWLVRCFGLPLASLHVGVNLSEVRPMDDVRKLWPRPVLIVHGTDDEIIPFAQGQRIFDAAPIGRSSFWVQHGSHNGILDDRNVIDRVVDFIRSAKPSPLV